MARATHAFGRAGENAAGAQGKEGALHLIAPHLPSPAKWGAVRRNAGESAVALKYHVYGAGFRAAGDACVWESR